MAATPAAVVDTRYCTPHATAFTVTEQLWNDFTVKDAGGAALMEIVSSAFFHTYHFVDVSASSRRPVLNIQRLPSLFGRTWEAYRWASTSRSNLLFVAVKAPSLFTWADIHVHLAGRGERDAPDFVVTTIPGFFSSCDCTVSRAGATVAQIRRTVMFGWVSYDVSVKAGVDHAFILALTAILEDIRRDDVRRKLSL